MHYNINKYSCRNYLEYVADTISEWTKQEEEKWQMEQEKEEAERTIQTPSETDRKRGNIYITNVKYMSLRKEKTYRQHIYTSTILGVMN